MCPLQTGRREFLMIAGMALYNVGPVQTSKIYQYNLSHKRILLQFNWCHQIYFTVTNSWQCYYRITRESSYCNIICLNICHLLYYLQNLKIIYSLFCFALYTTNEAVKVCDIEESWVYLLNVKKATIYISSNNLLFGGTKTRQIILSRLV